MSESPRFRVKGLNQLTPTLRHGKPNR